MRDKNGERTNNERTAGVSAKGSNPFKPALKIPKHFEMVMLYRIVL
jgi:hypothetical protein